MQPIYLSYFIDTKTPVYGGKKGTISINNLSSIAQHETLPGFVCIPAAEWKANMETIGL